jgi:hypothetical protein
MNSEFGSDGSDFPGNPKVSPRLVAGRLRSSPGTVFPGQI